MPQEEVTRELPTEPTRQLPRTTAVRSARRVAVGIAGGVCCLTAIVIIPIPGPWSIALAFIGLTVLSWEFHWAKRLRVRVQRMLREYRAKARFRR
ncbi:MAG: PGPGW domain-containing protein [Candidatus Methylomirabilales bacterium]